MASYTRNKNKITTKSQHSINNGHETEILFLQFLSVEDEMFKL